jgi:hypothetical protein
MRVPHIPLAACLCAATLTACAGGAGGTFTARPGEHFTMKRTANSTATLSDLASQVTTDTLLHNKGARLLKAEPFPPCPGEAGDQTFALVTARGPAFLRVAFTQWNGTTTIASYQRPAKASDDPDAVNALRRAVCSA